MISEYLGFDSDYIILGLAAFCVIFKFPFLRILMVNTYLCSKNAFHLLF